jgi:AcrR family transcriptional regulator
MNAVSMNLSYISYLEDQLAKEPPKQKGLRTRERLRIATAKMLSQLGYHAMRAIDITDEAGVAEGLFYTYFKDKLEITLSVLRSMMEDFYAKQSAALDSDTITSSGEPVYDAIYRANLKWILMCRANSGLMRCVLQVSDQEPEFASLWQRINSAWYKRVAEGISRHRSGKEPALMFTLMLGAMMDETARKLIVYPDPDLLRLLRDLDGDDELIAHATSLVWLRILYPDVPLPPKLPKQAQLLAQGLVS